MELSRITHIVTHRVSRNALFWLVFAFFHYYPRDHFLSYLVVLGYSLVAFGIPVYINNLLLMPLWLVKRRHTAYVLFFLPLLAATIGWTRLLHHWAAPFLPAGAGPEMMDPSAGKGMMAPLFPILLLFVLMAFGKLLHDAIGHQRDAEVLRQQRLAAELQQLHSQMNPHFLFNSLNTLYGMARRTDGRMADAVMQLSDILRHSIYESGKEEIPVEEEIKVIRQYVDFARLRLHQESDIRLLVEAPSGTGGLTIVPLLMLPFIENAVKHGVEGAGLNGAGGGVDIRLCLRDRELYFTCVNAFSAAGEPGETGGIGLSNVRRRLELCYPGRHELRIGAGGETWEVSLKIQLT